MWVPPPSVMSARVITWRKIQQAFRRLRALGGRCGRCIMKESIRETLFVRFGSNFQSLSKWIVPWMDIRSS